MAEKKKEPKARADKPVKAEKKPVVKRERKPKEAKKAVTYEKVYTIPLRKVFNKAKQIRAPYAMRLIRSFLGTHLKADEDSIRLGDNLNKKVWERSIQKPPRKVKVGVRKSGNLWLAELDGFEFIEFKPVESKKPEGMAEKLASRMGGKASKNEEEEKLIGGKASESEAREGPRESKVSPASE